MFKTVPDDKELAAYLRRYRYDAGMSGAEAGALIGKKPSTIYKYESGRLPVSAEDLATLLVAYGVDLDRAFTEKMGPEDRGRKKNRSAKNLRELTQIYGELPEAGQLALLEHARCARAYYRDEGRDCGESVD